MIENIIRKGKFINDNFILFFSYVNFNSAVNCIYLKG